MENKLSLNIINAKIFANLKKFGVYRDIIFAIAILAIIGVLLFPIKQWLVDLLLAMSITISVIILMTVLFISKPLDFSSFPTVLLLSTMLRLSLNIATTRLILGQGHMGPSSAGRVVEAFGVFIMQGSVIIGAIVFGILTIINFVVITKGSGRIAEVAARFSLDAMPGKQMAIDADFSVGLIDEATARARRKELEDESSFFGAMDGANKFVRGDAIAGLLIIFINFIGGMIIGIIQKNMSFSIALKTYTLLTIGDGLVSQIPALIVSVAAGLLVTKSGISGSAEKAVLGQLGAYPQAMWVSAGLLSIIGIMPGMPAFPFLFTSSIIGLTGFLLQKQKNDLIIGNSVLQLSQKNLNSGQNLQALGSSAHQGEQQINAPSPSDDAQLSDILNMDIIKLELGYGLLAMIENGKLSEKIKAIRKQFAKDLGFIIPSVRIQDNLTIGEYEYVIKIKDMQCAKASVKINHLMVLAPGNQEIAMSGENTVEPAFGMKAKWIHDSMRDEAANLGYTIVEPTTVIATHLTEVLREGLTDIFSYSAAQKLLDGVVLEHRKVITDNIPVQVNLTTVHRTLQGLLQEYVSIKDLPNIVEAIVEIISSTKSITKVVEHVRLKLARQICNERTNDAGYIPVVSLSPAWERTFLEGLVNIEGSEEKQLVIPPTKLHEFATELNKCIEEFFVKEQKLCLMVCPPLRPHLRLITERFKPLLPVISQAEVYPRAKIKSVKII